MENDEGKTEGYAFTTGSPMKDDGRSADAKSINEEKASFPNAP